MTSSVLVVDDEPDIVVALKYNLERQGYRVLTARDGAQALERVFESRPDLVILDLLLPGRNGLEVLREIRSDPATREIPVILLTAKGDEVDRLSGFEAGADDYVVKPFSPREVLARVKAVLRRRDVEPEENLLQSGEIAIDPVAHEVRLAGRALPLTAREYDLLVFLIRKAGRALRREELLTKVWGYDYIGGTRTVDVHIRRLRVKLGPQGKQLATVPSVGYKWTGPVPVRN